MRTRTDHLILWPSYFDSRRKRSEGRRVPRSAAVEKPTAEEIARAAGSMGLEAKILEGKAYPRNWWAREGCVSVENAMPKTRLLREVALKVKEMRAAR